MPKSVPAQQENKTENAELPRASGQGTVAIEIDSRKRLPKIRRNELAITKDWDTKSELGLTNKQEAFARLVGFENKNRADAYREAYDAKDMKPGTLHTEASLLANHPKVAQRIIWWERQFIEGVSRSADRDRAWLAESLRSIAVDASNTSHRLRALELLGKLTDVAAFTERTEDVTKHRSAADIEAEIRESLDKLGLLSDK